MSNHRPLHSCDLGSAGVGSQQRKVEGGVWQAKGEGGQRPFRPAPNRKLAVLFLPQILFVTLLSIMCLSTLMALDRS